MSDDRLVARLRGVLERSRAAYCSSLLPGLDERALGRLEETVGHRLPADFRALYGWKDGQPPNCFESFFENYMWMSSEAIVHACRELVRIRDDDVFPHRDWWCDAWVPFLSNGGGDYLCLDFRGSFGGTPCQVLEFWHDDDSRTIRHASFAKWIETVVVSLEESLETYRDGFGLGAGGTRDRKAYRALCARINPGYPRRARIERQR